jgi:regulator of protease activity HflC (stomatin/prohibitin superfamily)
MKALSRRERDGRSVSVFTANFVKELKIVGAEVERERRAKVIAAEGEYQAAQRLADAAAIMAKEPIALQLRFLQTLVEIASENNSTTIFPVPVDILKPFLSTKGDRMG